MGPWAPGDAVPTSVTGCQVNNGWSAVCEDLFPFKAVRTGSHGSTSLTQQESVRNFSPTHLIHLTPYGGSCSLHWHPLMDECPAGRKGREGRSQGRKEGVSRCCFWRKEGKSEGRKGRSQGRRRKEGASPPAVHRARAAPPAGAGRYRGPGLAFLPHAADLRGHLRTLPGSGSWLVSGSCRIPEMALCVCCCCAWTVPAEELLSVMVSMHCWTSQLD